MGSSLMDQLTLCIEKMKPDVACLDKKRNKLASIRVRKNAFKAMRLIRTINSIANAV